jgi:phage shock protein PspC (stress-responsive transcriptional regulator)
VNQQPTDRSEVAEPPLTTDPPRTVYGAFLGVLAGLAVAVAYGLAAELLGLTFSLPVVGLVGGWVIGTAVAYGAWGDREHLPVGFVRSSAAVVGAGAWLVGLIVAYVVSQALIPQASNPLLDRLSLAGLLDYLFGTFDFVRLLHLVALALLAFVAWRSAR